MNEPLRTKPCLAVLALTIPVLLALPARAADAATSPQDLLAQAVRNTNSVNTLVYSGRTVQTTKTATISIVNSGQEDEGRNRERDHEAVTIQARQSNGTSRKAHYTIDIVFMNGKTYYRGSLAKNQWHVRSGLRLCDQLIGTCWQRRRTTVPTFQGAKLTVVGQTSPGSETHLRAPFNQQGAQGTVDVWISAGSTPYVTRVDESAVATAKGQKVREQSSTRYGPFNQPLNIVAPPVTG